VRSGNDARHGGKRIVAGRSTNSLGLTTRNPWPYHGEECQARTAMKSVSCLLAAYDVELRTEAETPSAVAVRTIGPLRLVTFARGRGFITYRDLAGADAVAIRNLILDALEHYRADATITRVEWKSRAHDHAPGMHQSLIDNGFVAGEEESIMIGEARLLATDVHLPDCVALRTIASDEEITRMSQMQAEVLGDLDPAPMAMALSERIARKDGMELWVAEADGKIICSGRLEPVQGTTFAGIWGGATRSDWRGKGISGTDCCSRQIRPRSWQEVDSQRFDRVLSAHSGKGGPAKGIDNHSIRLEAQ